VVALAAPADVPASVDLVDALALADLADVLASADLVLVEHRDFCLRVDRAMLRAVLQEGLHRDAAQVVSVTRRAKKAQ
jgi:predicted GTPase